jgi:hypothetical protein
VTPLGVEPENGGHNVFVIETNSHRATLMDSGAGGLERKAPQWRRSPLQPLIEPDWQFSRSNFASAVVPVR